MRPIVPLNEEARDYLLQARHNFRLYQQLRDQGEFLDWAITVLFYTALHLVQAHAWQFGEWQPSDHDNRRKYIENSRISVMKRDYARLAERSRDARYDRWSITAEELKDWEDGAFGRILGVLRRNGIDLHAELPPEADTKSAG